MNLAIAYNTMNKLDLTKQTFPVLRDGDHALLWSDGSTNEDARDFFALNKHLATESYPDVRGGADAGIAHALTRLLQHPAKYTHVGLVENDVMLDADWQVPTMALFAEGKADGLRVGAVSARSYVDRVLIQRDDYAVMLNVGAGMIVMTRDAAEIVLQTFKTGWWPTTRYIFAQVSGIDIATFACFRGQEQFTTSDWSYETNLARMGYATLALTPSKASMVGQVPSLVEQGLELTQHPVEARRNEKAFAQYRDTLNRLGPCADGWMFSDGWSALHREGNGLTIFAHQLGFLPGSELIGEIKLKWVNGFGPFAYEAGEKGFMLSVRVSGACNFLVSGGASGGKVEINDGRSGFNFSPKLPPDAGNLSSLAVPGGPVLRKVTLRLEPGTVFLGLSTTDPQILDSTFKFDWSQLPSAE